MADINNLASKTGRALKEDNSYINLANISADSIGQTGSKEITGTSAVTPPTGFYFWSIVPSSDMVISAQGNVTSAINADLTAIASHPTGVPIYGKFNSITLTSGDGIGYLAKE